MPRFTLSRAPKPEAPAAAPVAAPAATQLAELAITATRRRR